MIVFAFDRDYTVDVSPPPDRRAVPLGWVEHLAHETDHEVWAIGNQKLTAEADVPGLQAAIRRLDGEWYETLGERVREAHHEEYPDRRQRVRMLERLFPDADRYVVVDDQDLSDLPGWDHYTGWAFVDAVEAGELGVDVPASDDHADGSPDDAGRS